MLALLLYMLSIVATNAVFAFGPIVPMGFGTMAPLATLIVGLTLTLRDVAQERLGKWWTIGAVVVGAGISAAFSPALALASGTAFLFSELADLAVYTPIRKRSRTLGMLASNAVGLVVDSMLFLWLAFGSLAFLPGQILAKTYSTLVAVAVIWWWRRHQERKERNSPVTEEESPHLDEPLTT